MSRKLDELQKETDTEDEVGVKQQLEDVITTQRVLL